ncbi:mucin-2 isoform X1 [Canis lupus familiaris]|uniref:mucin-2 isoform X1 n=1 Tax=Canis lupus familiaris TaxID=9615 RepID=UPI0018F7D9F3|nr:mucin-2 isoform X1 [Canis lupus familiaris]
MGLPLARLVAICLVLSSARGAELQREGRTRNHGHSVCSTWGDFHYKTFDGDVFRFPGLCDYNFASDCRDSYKEFAVHLKRGAGRDGKHPQLEYILLSIKDDTIYLTPQLVVVNGALVSTPHYSSGLLIEKNDAYTKVYSRAGLTLMWNREDSLMLELDSRFQNHTCGLCGDYNGLQTYSEFLSDGVLFSAIEFGTMQKINKPGVVCDDPEEEPALESCSEHRAECERLLTASAFKDCLGLLPLELYVQACAQDRCRCPVGTSCACSTLAEFSRQCSHAGGQPGNWRTAELCPKSCPGNMVYLESGSPCMDTCSHLEVSSLCEEHHMDGCFCPEGTVYDDITGSGCIPVSQCHCRLHGHLYSPGQQITNECEECVCTAGRWVCKDLPCPGTCSLEGGSHITTFDGKKYTFHGDCYYVLIKGDHNDSYALLGELAPCGSTDKQTCLKTVVLLADNRKNVLAFKSDGSVLLNELEVNLPHVTASFSVFQPSSYHLMVNTAFGLRLQVQLLPVMQLFLTLDQVAQGHVQGLCGNFNGQEGDDFKTPGGLVEATGASFANSWKAQSNCHDKLDWLDDPCSLNIESANYAEHWCSLLKKTETPFSKCHAAVDPSEYYKRCKYDTCNCQNSESCMCAALSSYARACATKGIMLWGWREQVCNEDVGSCPNSQVFLYNLTTCQQTCRSLSEADTHCVQGFAPVDGCGCPVHTFLDEKGRCVSLAKCSCYYHGLYLEAGEVVLRQEERCVCRNGRLHCMQVKLLGQSCPSPKIHIDCNNLTAVAIQNPRPVSCQTLAAGHYQTECVSGCICPSGLLDDGRGGCVVEEDCPCVHNHDLYSPGDKIKVDCNTCTCQRGRWTCTQSVCYGSCSIYGSGHYITFDGKYYDFDGHCSYVAAQDYCGHNASLGSFSIITENVPCGTTGVTCSKAIKIFIGRTELKLENKQRLVVQRDTGHAVSYTTRDVGQYLVVEASIGVIIIWDRKTTIFIKLSPSYKGTVCGLCGNFDQRSSNDFTTRDHMVVDSELDFGNSWKEAPTCPDVSSTPEPCVLRPHRLAWAEKQCSIIKSSVFSSCHSKVDPKPFYEACVHDSCSCDSGGDCECFCSAVASYAQECTKEGACVFWRTPDLCPIFCDYYNPPDECEWHYEPCGNRSFETCRTINGIHSNISVSYLEGCYPRCPKDRPIYDEDLKKCVTADKCGCYVGDTHYPPGASVPAEKDCHSCVCTNSSKVVCWWDEGKILNYTQDGFFCYWEICGPNGTVERHFNVCVTSTPLPSTTIPVTSTPVTTTTTTTTTTTPTPSTGTQTSGPPSSKTTPTSATTPRPSSTTPPTPPTPQTTSTTTSHGPTPTQTSISSPHISESTEFISSSTLVYCCVLNDTYYIPGDVVYNGTHGDTCYFVNCSLSCTLEIFNWSCPSTPSPTPTPSKSTPTSTPKTPTPVTSSTPTTSKPPGCPDFIPPRQENETWWLCNCTMAICKYNNTVELVEVECEPPPMPTCTNGLQPVRVLDPDGCCWHWECDCYCTGWGDPHYVTFDGLYYSYQGNCTYVLVEEITSKVDNFGVYIDNYHCDVNDQVSCPRTLIVRHESQEVLIKTLQLMPIKVQVQVNRQVVALPYRKYGLQVYQSGINYVVDIPELGAVISYNGLSFSIRLPYQHFGNNTKGQCGTCTNNTADDCMLPSGEVVSNCEFAADHWVVNDPSKPHCPQTGVTTKRPLITPPGGSSTTHHKDCASSLCELIKDSLFAQCHALVPPQHYYDACVFDTCFVPGSGLECASLQAYAALCAHSGICVDWRNHTHGVCSVTCPPHREYRACGPAEEPTCESRPSEANTSLVEGCFCPEGTTSYAPGYDVCVELCGCVGPDDVPRKFGEHFEFDCKDCVCLEGGRGIVCEPKECRQEPLECTEDGTYPLTEVNPADPCCNITSCKCNTSLCQETPPKCPLGFEVKSETRPGKCCPSYSCVPKGVCVHGNAEYQPGSPVYSSKCQDCVCTTKRNSTSQLNIISCSHVPCNNSCNPGFELVEVPKECCGKCVQTHCIIKRPDKNIILKPGDIHSDPKNNCTFFSCVKIHNQLISSVSNITCPDFDPSICIPGSITLMPNGCCKKCIPRNETRIYCSTIPVTKEISYDGCSNNITMNYCSGSCGTFAMYSAEAQGLDHSCSCCKEERTSQRQVVLQCPQGGSKTYTYTHIESCQCQDTVCGLPQTQRSVPRRARRASPRGL